MSDDNDIAQLTLEELEAFVQDCRIRIAECRAQIEPPRAARGRSLKLIRGTVLNVGGFIGATFDPLALFLVVLGTWDWFDGFREDAAAMNKRNQLLREAIELDRDLAAAELRLQQLRKTATS